MAYRSNYGRGCIAGGSRILSDMFLDVSVISVSAGVSVTHQGLAVKTAEAGEAPSEPSQPALGEIVNRVMILESSGGRHNYSKCEAIGKYNRFGYSIPGNGTYKCYEKDEDTKVVMEWFDKKLKKHSLKESLCLYNRGIVTESCDYIQKFEAI